MEAHGEHREPFWDHGFLAKIHFRLGRRPTTFFPIAVVAGDDDVVPARCAALRTGHDVIDCRVGHAQ